MVDNMDKKEHEIGKYVYQRGIGVTATAWNVMIAMKMSKTKGKSRGNTSWEGQRRVLSIPIN
jgi:hypothetical protein